MNNHNSWGKFFVFFKKKKVKIAKKEETKAVAELKKELQRVVEAIVEEEEEEDDDCNLEATDIAIQTLYALKDLKLKQTDQEFVKLKSLAFQEPPPEFRCPISGILMKDPVVLASGQTYEEPFIRKWLKDGHQTCPQTEQLLPHTVIIPNHSVKKVIMNWCKVHKVDMPRSSLTGDEDYAANANREHLIELLERLSSSSISDQTRAAKELRLLTSRLPSFRALFGEIMGSIPQLFSPLLIEKAYSDAGLHNDLVAAILNIATHESNRRIIVAGSPSAISFLVESLRSKSIETRSHAAAALSALSALDSNKHIIGKSGAFRPLIELMEEGHPLALKDAAMAISNLCTLIENRERAVSEGAVITIMDKIIDCVLIDELLEILAMLSSHQRAIEEMEEHGMLFCLFSILREETGEQNKENCVAIIYAMCFSDRTKLRKINEVENAYETLSLVARTGTSRAKRKATGILERLNRFAFVSHTA